MKSIIVSVLIFTCTLSFVLFANYKLNSLCDLIIYNCNIVLEELPNNNWDDIQIICENLLNEIEKANVLSSIYINHNDYDTLNHEALKLYYGVSTQDETEAYTSAAILQSYSKKIKELSKPTIENIL